MTDPRIKLLAKEAARKIKTLPDAHHTQLEEIYQDFRSQADAIKREVSADELDNPSADSIPTDRKESIGDFHYVKFSWFSYVLSSAR